MTDIVVYILAQRLGIQTQLKEKKKKKKRFEILIFKAGRLCSLRRVVQQNPQAFI